MTFIYIILALVILTVLYGISSYNGLVKKRTMMEEGWSGIDVQLKKRYNLIPNLLKSVKGYAAHEQETLDMVIKARNSAQNASSVGSQIAAEGQLQTALSNVFALAESYPDLKANANFIQFQNELGKIENDIDKSRRYYNATVRENNVAVESFPSNIFAKAFNFDLGEYFELEDLGQRAMPDVNF